jgi:hypothetical protein
MLRIRPSVEGRSGDSTLLAWFVFSCVFLLRVSSLSSLVTPIHRLILMGSKLGSFRAKVVLSQRKPGWFVLDLMAFKLASLSVLITMAFPDVVDKQAQEHEQT